MPKAVFFLSVDGTDVTSNFDPVLETLTIKDSDGGKADTLQVTLNDAGGHIFLPRPGVSISAGIGWEQTGPVQLFDGTVDEVTSSGARGQGSILTISAKSADMRGKVKQPRERHKDNATFEEAAKEFAQASGLTVKVDKALAAIHRPYWAIANESFPTWGVRMAHELGMTFKIMGKTAVFVARSSGQSTSGQALPTIDVTYGDNLEHWSLSPILSRPDFESYVVRWFDGKSVKYKQEEVQAQATGDTVTAKHVERFKHANSDEAKNRAKSNSKEGDRDKGGGSVTIVGNPQAQSEAMCNIAGIRPGIDGAYRIKTATHKYVRGGGYQTDLEVRQPSGDAGSDGRGASSGKTSSSSPGVTGTNNSAGGPPPSGSTALA